MSAASFNGVMVIVLVATLDAWFVVSPSSTAQFTVLVAEIDVGLSLVDS